MGKTETNEYELFTMLMEGIIRTTDKSQCFLEWTSGVEGIYSATRKNACELTFIHTPDTFELHVIDKSSFHPPIHLNPVMYQRGFESQFGRLEEVIKLQLAERRMTRVISNTEYLEHLKDLVQTFS